MSLSHGAHEDREHRLSLRHLIVGGALLASAFVAAGAGLRAQRAAPSGSWLTWGGDSAFTRYSPLALITKDNVGDLQVLWRWRAADRDIQASNPLWRSGRNEDTPLMVNGTLYTVTGLGLIAALDPATGETRWVYDPQGYKIGGSGSVYFVQRGLAYWTDGKQERVLAGTNDAFLVSLDAKTGKPDPKFGTNGKVDLLLLLPFGDRASRQVSARRPLVAGDVILAGSSINDGAANKEMPPGWVQAYDVRTGKRVWAFHTVPRAGEFGIETWEGNSAEYSGNANVWAGMAYDPELDYVYLPSSTPTNDYYGGHRLGNNLFAESLICVEAKTGRRVWHFQAVHHGLWDYDFPATPLLGDITVGGRTIKAVMQPSKQAFVYVFDRKTGVPVWPIEERPVPQSNVPGERTSPTQPFPTKPPAFDLQGTTEDNLVDFTPALRERARTQLANFDHGPLFTPPTLKGMVMLPGIVGGANWPGGAFDPETQTFYVASRMNPSLLRVAPADAKSNFRYTGAGGGPGQGGVGKLTAEQLADLMTLDGLPLFKPPYFRLTAIDMKKGETLWMSPLGNGPRRHPLLQGLNLPPLGGDYQRGSVLVTKTLLFVAMSAVHSRGVPQRAPWARWADPADERNLIHVFDKLSGALLRTVELDGMSAAAPMTYLHGGRQYIAVATGGGPSSEIVALGLPSGPVRTTTEAAAPTRTLTARSVWGGVYTEEQATRGRSTYDTACAACHLENLQGGGLAPGLVADAFTYRWQDGPVADLFTVIKQTMPSGQPASLRDEEYVDIVAYLLKRNDYPSGSSELGTSVAELKEIGFAKSGSGR
jgi:quinoprotein glucose dehydrogenase